MLGRRNDELLGPMNDIHESHGTTLCPLCRAQTPGPGQSFLELRREAARLRAISSELRQAARELRSRAGRQLAEIERERASLLLKQGD
jgi:hypothetical protein